MVSLEIDSPMPYTRTESYGDTSIRVHDRGIVSPDVVPRKAMLREFGVVGVGGWAEARKDDRDTTPHRLAAIERSLCGREQAFHRFGIRDAARLP